MPSHARLQAAQKQSWTERESSTPNAWFLALRRRRILRSGHEWLSWWVLFLFVIAFLFFSLSQWRLWHSTGLKLQPSPFPGTSGQLFDFLDAKEAVRWALLNGHRSTGLSVRNTHCEPRLEWCPQRSGWPTAQARSQATETAAQHMVVKARQSKSLGKQGAGSYKLPFERIIESLCCAWGTKMRVLGKEVKGCCHPKVTSSSRTRWTEVKLSTPPSRVSGIPE